MLKFTLGLCSGSIVVLVTLVTLLGSYSISFISNSIQKKWGSWWLSFDYGKMEAKPDGDASLNGAARVVVEAARSADVPITLSGIGTVQAYNTVNVRSRIDGEITRILFHEGQDVKAGDPLALIDPRPLQAQLDQQEAARDRDHALLDGALLDLQRYEALVLKEFASRQQVDRQRTLVAQYAAQIKTDEALIAYARTQLAYTTVVAPLAGRTGVRMVDEGNYVRAADASAIVVVTQLQPISVVFTLAASAVQKSRLNLGEIEVPVQVFAADEHTVLDNGMVRLVDNQVDPATGTIKLKATFPNTKLNLWPGNFVNGRITVDVRLQGVTIPIAALRHGPRGDFVFVVQNGQKYGLHVVTRAVVVGQSNDGHILIEKGLAAGEAVVTEGHYRLEDGTPIILIDKPKPRPERLPRIPS